MNGFFFVNGNKQVLDGSTEPDTTLLYFLRDKLHLTGCKEGCGEGGCGACTVIISKFEQAKNILRHWSVNACLVPLFTLDGLAVTTIEGIGSTRDIVHPCQKSIACGHGSQCGYCTPGMVMSMFSLLHKNSEPSELDIEEALYGNLCRCTGYRPIMSSFSSLCESVKCNNEKSNNDQVDSPLDINFPTELKTNVAATFLCITGSRMTWYRPVSLKQLLLLKEDIPDSQLVGGGISLGLELSQKGYAHHCVYITLSHIPELTTINETDQGLHIGAMITMGQLEDQLKENIFKLPGTKVNRLEALREMLSWYAGQQIKNVATLGGNVMNSLSDILTVLVSINAKAIIMSKDTQREVVFNSTKTTLQLATNEALVSILIPWSEKDEQIAVFKQTRRKHFDTSIISACLRVKLQDRNIKQCHLVYGGLVSDGPFEFIKTEQKMIGEEWNKDLLSMTCNSLTEELSLDDTTRMKDYKMNLCLSFFFKFHLQVLSSFNKGIPAKERSAIVKQPCHPIKGSQGFQQVSSNIIGQSLMHQSAMEQATGEARYVNDMPHIDGEGYAGLILSEVAHASFTVDYSGLDALKGVIGYVSAQDVPSCNVVGLGNDDLLFADKVVTSVGQLIAIVVAKNKQDAQRAVQAIKVKYIHLPTILTFEEAIANKSFYKPERCIKSGDIETAFAGADYIKEGKMKIGGQEQFYMETFACIAIPKGEHKDIDIIASTQNLSECQSTVAKALGVPNNRVTVKVTRIGGGFGGKESRCNVLYGAVAVAANKFNIPVRMKMLRNQDMAYSGARHPFLGKYKVGFSEKGKIEALDVDIYLNGGFSEDLSVRVMEAAIINIQSVYHIPNASIRGHVCRTNLPSNTAMRGFGTPEALLIMETIVSHISDTLNKEKIQIQELNFLKDGQEFLYGMKVHYITIQRCMSTLIEKCQYYEKKKEIEEFNRNNRWRKRGIAVVPTLHGIGFFEYLPLNQTGALLHVYTDGSVLLTHGGIEMGQGLHTKMIQVCAKCLNIPIEKIHISETSTDKVPNMIPTSASVSTDYNGMAVQDACLQILSSMKPFIDDDPNGSWEEWVEAAYHGRVSLSARGYYKTPDFGIRFTDDGCNKGNAYLYHTYGAGCSIVEVDILTGTTQILKSDLLMDVGNSINPAIDIGQVEGAFTQGLGLFTMEELIFTTDGCLYTNGPNTYKIPGISDVPFELNVSLLDRCPNPNAIFSSKGIGEPPLFLAASVFFAIKEAVKSARVENGMNTDYFEFHSPATVEKIKLACGNQVY